jgi:hypothetical protein
MIFLSLSTQVQWRAVKARGIKRIFGFLPAVGLPAVNSRGHRHAPLAALINAL